MNVYQYSNSVAAITAAKHLRLKARIRETVEDNYDPDIFCLKLYTAKVQVKILGLWVTVWSERCDYSDGDTRPYIRNCAEEVLESLTKHV